MSSSLVLGLNLDQITSHYQQFKLTNTIAHIRKHIPESIPNEVIDFEQVIPLYTVSARDLSRSLTKTDSLRSALCTVHILCYSALTYDTNTKNIALSYQINSKSLKDNLRRHFVNKGIKAQEVNSLDIIHCESDLTETQVNRLKRVFGPGFNLPFNLTMVGCDTGLDRLSFRSIGNNVSLLPLSVNEDMNVGVNDIVYETEGNLRFMNQMEQETGLALDATTSHRAERRNPDYFSSEDSTSYNEDDLPLQLHDNLNQNLSLGLNPNSGDKTEDNES